MFHNGFKSKGALIYVHTSSCPVFLLSDPGSVQGGAGAAGDQAKKKLSWCPERLCWQRMCRVGPIPGNSLCAEMNRLMAACNSDTERNMPCLRRRWVRQYGSLMPRTTSSPSRSSCEPTRTPSSRRADEGSKRWCQSTSLRANHSISA